MVKVLKSASRVDDAEPLPVIEPQEMLPEPSVVRAFEPEHEPKRPSVVVPVLEIEKSVVVALAVDEPIAKST